MKPAQAEINPINILQLSIGCSLLIAGVSIYLFFRGPEKAFFIHFFKLPYFYDHECGGFLNGLIQNFPSFLHPCSFSLLTCALLPSQNKKSFFIVCSAWSLLNILCEFGQLISNPTLTFFPFTNRLLSFPLNYFQYGIFDPKDIIFSITGSILAYFILITTVKGKTHEIWTRIID